MAKTAAMNDPNADASVQQGGAVPPGQEAMTTMTHTVDEIPELAGKGVGDVIAFTITAVSDDGKTYDMEIVPEGQPAEATPAPEAPAPVGGGKSAINQSMMA
jgi:hypothetical protein